VVDFWVNEKFLRERLILEASDTRWFRPGQGEIWNQEGLRDVDTVMEDEHYG
jgi:hypothetical protein